jgi:CHAD domain-containing protein
MAFRIDFSRPVAEELERVLGEQFEIARVYLDEAGTEALDEAVHELRKTTKKLRSVLRLASNAFSRKFRRRQIDALRQIADLLAPDRDAVVLERSLKGACEASLPSVDWSTCPVGNMLSVQPTATNAVRPVDSDRLDLARALLTRTSTELTNREVGSVDFETLLSGTIRSYRRARRILHALRERTSVALLHDLRKRVKDQLYQIRLLAGLSPVILSKEAAKFKQLADLLGEHHDLAGLLNAMIVPGSRFREVAEHAAAFEWVSKRIADLELESIQLARHMLEESPRSRRLRMTWLFDETFG